MSKFRSSFVTNSSSSSFICEVSGEVEAGYDMGIEDAGMYECENGHTFCECYLVGTLGSFTKEDMIKYLEDFIASRQAQYDKSKKDYLLNYIKDGSKKLEKLVAMAEEDSASYIEELVDEMNLNSRYEIPSVNCPICTMTHIRTDETVSYLLKKYDTTLAETEKEIKEKFKTLKDFKKSL